MIRLCLADDEELIRTALAALLALEPDIEVVGTCADGLEAVALARELRPDVFLLDLEMPGLDGVAAAERMQREAPVRTVIITRHARPGVLRRALAARVTGFAPKSTSATELAGIIRRIAAGHRYVDPEIAAAALSSERSPLTDRELDVLRVGRTATSVAAIAAELGLAQGTVRNYLSQAMGKLGVASRQEASERAWEEGWI